MAAKMYYIYKQSPVDKGYFYVFKMAAYSPNEVRWTLAENNYEGRFMWNTGKSSRKNYYASLYR